MVKPDSRTERGSAGSMSARAPSSNCETLTTDSRMKITDLGHDGYCSPRSAAASCERLSLGTFCRTIVEVETDEG